MLTISLRHRSLSSSVFKRCVISFHYFFLSINNNFAPSSFSGQQGSYDPFGDFGNFSSSSSNPSSSSNLFVGGGGGNNRTQPQASASSNGKIFIFYVRNCLYPNVVLFINFTPSSNGKILISTWYELNFSRKHPYSNKVHLFGNINLLN